MKKPQTTVRSLGDGAGAEWVKRYRQSGLSLRAFAREHQLKPAQLHYWTYGGRRATAIGKSTFPPLFQEIALPVSSLGKDPWAAEIQLPNGTVARLSRAADGKWMQTLLRLLLRPC